MPNQLAIVGSPDLYSQAARRFLQLIPTACINAERMFLDSIQRPITPPPNIEDTPPPIFTSSPLPGQTPIKRPTPTHVSQGTPLNNTAMGTPSLNPFDAPHSGRSRSGSDASTSSLVSISSSSAQQTTPSRITTTPTMKPLSSLNGVDEERKSVGIGKYSSTKSNGLTFQFEYVNPEVAYLKNLMVVRDTILECATCCRCWSSPYDKCIVSKEALAQELENEPPPVKKSLEMEDVAIRVRVTSEGDGEEDNFDFGRFRSRATTVSAQPRNVRANNLRPKRELEENTAISKSTDQAHDESPSVSPTNRRRRATVKDRTSPRLARKQFGNTFEDKIGLFMKIVLEKLFDMLQLPPSVNVLLTRLISRLAEYPQPLLRSLLLNHHLVLRSGIPNLLYVSCIMHTVY